MSESLSGFHNRIYLNNDYALKLMPNNKQGYEKELFIYTYFKSEYISKLIDYGYVDNIPYILLKRNEGVPVYSVWHKLKTEDREKIVAQIADIIKELNKLETQNFSYKGNFKDKIINTINELVDDKIFMNLKDDIISFVNRNVKYLDNIECCITYSDLHFDNILVAGNRVTTIFDFENIEYAPKDFVLDIWHRMQKYPHLFANLETEKFVNKEDYNQLMLWMQRYYPELFEEKEVYNSLKLYSLYYDMKMLKKYPNEQGLIKRLKEVIEERI
jgi:aminoglycoside phosphotransferase (APT) family kinase protein